MDKFTEFNINKFYFWSICMHVFVKIIPYVELKFSENAYS